MDLQTRKIQFIQEVLRLKNEKIIEKPERLLHQEKEKIIEQEFSKMTIDELNSLIDHAENDSENGRIFNAGEIV